LCNQGHAGLEEDVRPRLSRVFALIVFLVLAVESWVKARFIIWSKDRHYGAALIECTRDDLSGVRAATTSRCDKLLPEQWVQIKIA
jgi:hypothetical protein